MQRIEVGLFVVVVSPLYVIPSCYTIFPPGRGISLW
jgi:hypothetical protein